MQLAIINHKLCPHRIIMLIYISDEDWYFGWQLQTLGLDKGVLFHPEREGSFNMASRF